MAVSRRGFIKKGSLLAVAAAASLASVERALGLDNSAEQSGVTQDNLTGKSGKTSALSLTKATFAPYVNTVFRIYPDTSKTLKTTLVSVADIGPVPDKTVAGRECFALNFRGSEPLPQNTYRIEHDVLGRLDLLLVPIGKNKRGRYYQAVINRLNG
jgi:hypothetical protein